MIPRTYLTIFLNAIIGILLSTNAAFPQCPGGASQRTSVIYINGILSNYEDAQEGLEKIEETVLNSIDAGTLPVQDGCVLFFLQYNPTNGLFNDLYESAKQWGLAQENIIVKILFGILPPPPTFSIWELAEQYLARELESQVTDDFGTLAKNVRQAGGLVMVGHSQGNLYVNRVYEDKLTESERERTFVLAVSTPADHIAGDGEYTTLVEDHIHWIPGARPPNADNGPCSFPASHYFVSSYMKAVEDLPDRPESFPQIRQQLIEAITTVSPPLPPPPPQPPQLAISTPTCSQGTSCSGPQGTTFTIQGAGFSPNKSVGRFIVDSSGTETPIMPVLTSDANGQISWSVSSSCSTPTGTYLMFAVDQETSTISNSVTEILTEGDCPTPLNPTWTQKFPAHNPSPRSGHAMAYDAARGQIVLFSGAGAINDTWVWDGTDWTQKFPGNSPSPRGGHAMAYDASREQVVLFGGISNNVALNDTWVWDGTDWTQKLPGNSPSPRGGRGMVYDAARGEVVLFGGAGVSILNDTWVWDGTDWTQIFPLSSPSRRGAPAMAYDAARGQVVLFGGTNYLNTTFNDTWVWDGTNWTQEFPVNSPLSRGGHAMAYDATRRQVILFGGSGFYSTSPWNDTWIWDGTNWTQEFPVNSPLPRGGHAMAYDATRRQVILFGGNSESGYANDTWVWPGNSSAAQWLTVDFPGAIATELAGINDSGQIVGNYVDSDLNNHGFLKDGSTFTTIDFPGAYVIDLEGISDSGQIVGNYYDSANKVHAFQKDGSTFTTIDFPGARETMVWGINDSGQIVGHYDDYDYNRHGFLKTGSTFTTIDFPGAFETWLYGINDSGQIVGYYSDSDYYNPHGFLKDGSTFTTIDIPGAMDVRLWEINDSGQIVGWYVDSDLNHHGFLKDGSTFTIIDFPGAYLTELEGINDSGQIVGYYSDSDYYNPHGFTGAPLGE